MHRPQKNMAAVVLTADMMIQRNSQILVNVDEVLSDLLVVSYNTEDRKFQGVLLDSSKRNLPFGVYNLHPAFNKCTETITNKDENLHSVSQRFTYQHPEYASENVRKPKKPGAKGKTQQKQKMTVRLRPRKVLCSNCKGICNENNENVDVSKKRKLDFHDDIPHDKTDSSNVKKKYLMSGTLIPKLSRLHPSEISSAIKGASQNSEKASEKQINKSARTEKTGQFSKVEEMAFVSVSEDRNCDKPDHKDSFDGSFNPIFSNARTLKICFGEGEGTVVKIPPISGDYNEDSGVSCDISKPESKAAKKALKRAKKEAKKNNALENKTKLEVWIKHSPKHIGALSPHNNVPSSQPDPLEKKHKHKVKHKKKHKLPKRRDENTRKCGDEDTITYFSDIKDHCLKQKLSISLRRLSSNSYEKRTEQDAIESGSEGGESDIPNFPPTGAEGVGGRILKVMPGDIVWGKVVGFPWWPGRVLSVTPTAGAHVAWFASSTSSLMPCDSLSPFLEDYKVRFNKKKRGPYKEAVKQATIEAKRLESRSEDPLASPNHASLETVSPHPIDVFS